MSLLEAASVSFAFLPSQPLFKEVHLRLAAGEMAVLLGANASGKTTLLRILAGLLNPDSGQVSIDGCAIRDAKDRVGLVFQNPEQQLIAATVEEEIALAHEFRTVPRHILRAKVEESLIEFNLSELRNRSPESLSGGQKQRVALASILTAEPDFLLLDEPDSFLDSASRSLLAEEIVKVRSHCGILWTVPHPRNAPDSADTHYFLEDGRLESLTRDEFHSIARG